MTGGTSILALGLTLLAATQARLLRVKRLPARFSHCRSSYGLVRPSFVLTPRSGPRCSVRGQMGSSASPTRRTTTDSTYSIYRRHIYSRCLPRLPTGLPSQWREGGSRNQSGKAQALARADSSRDAVNAQVECWQSIHFPFRTAAEVGFPDEHDVPESQQREIPRSTSTQQSKPRPDTRIKPVRR